MEGIYTPLSLRTELVHTFLYPFGSITGYKLYRGELFLCKKFEELGEYRFSVSFMSPDNLAGIVVYYNGDVLVSLLVAGLIHADVDESDKLG